MLENENDINMTNNDLLFDKNNINDLDTNNNIFIGGYDEDLVINKNYLLSLDDIYKCKICYKIMINPVECETCGHNFCYNCINSSDCPFGCKDKTIKQSSLAIKNLLGQIRFKCPNKGCTESFDYSKIEIHKNECQYKLVKCPNKNCEKIMLRKDVLNHANNECEFLLIKCKYCNYEFIKKEIEHHENICKLLNTERDSLNCDINKISVDEHLKRLSKNLNEIIKNNQKLVEYSEKQNANDNIQNNNYPNRISIRKSIVPGLEGDEFLDIINKEIENKIKNYYNEFNDNLIKLIKEIDDIKELLKHYLNNIIIENNFNKNENENFNLEKEEKIKKKENEEEIKKYINELIEKTENNLKNLIKNYKKKFSNEFSSINSLDNENNEEENKDNNINEKDINKNNNKDMYSIINNIFNNLKKYIYEANNEIKTLSNNFHNNLNDIIKNNSQDLNNIGFPGIKGNLNISIIDNNIKKLFKESEEKLENELKDNNNNKLIIGASNLNNKESNNQLSEINGKKYEKEVNCLNNQVENINNSLSNIKNNIKQAINIINEKFSDFSELVKNNLKNKKKVNKNNLSYDICPITSFSLFKINSSNENIDINNNNTNSFYSEECLNIINNNILNPLDIIKNLESRMSSLENNSKDFSLAIKERVKSELLNKLNEINTNIESDIDKKIEKVFSLKYCKECQKIDYFYGFIKCSLCNEDNCKQCIVVCINCKNFCCIKCCLCKKCDKLICKNCRILCISCNNKYCQFCIMNCPLCNQNICSNCFFQCSLCNKNICKINCSKICNICDKTYCNVCSKDMKFFKCNLCNNLICEKCDVKCKEHDKIVCKNCCEKCHNCKNDFCIKFIIECNDCQNKYCLNCGKNFEDNNSCKLCKNIYCDNCSINHKNCKCISCLKQICNKCSLKCINCSSNICKECSIICKSCNNASCIKCSSECICGIEKFCHKCLQKKEALIVHDCIYFLNNCAITESKKTRSLKKISNKFNIEAKFNVFMNDISDQSFLLVGITDNKKFEENDSNEVKNIFAVNVNNGDKFSSDKGFEDFLDFENINKGFNDVYIMIKEYKLFFKINNSIYKWAYELKRNCNYWFYLENNILNSTSKFLYIRKIK